MQIALDFFSVFSNYLFSFNVVFAVQLELEKSHFESEVSLYFNNK